MLPAHARRSRGLVIAAGLAASAPAAASPARPPAALQQAAAALGCASIAWSTWRGGWWADCASTEPGARDGEVTVHRYVAFRRLPDGQFAMEPITETRATDSPRVKSPRTETVVQRDGRVVHEARTESGYLHRRIWDLTASPARLIEERDGGGKLCRDGFDRHSSDVVRRSCTTDFAARRQRCTAPQPSCRRDPVAIAAPSYTAIPVHAAGAALRDADLFHCATEIGGRPEDVVAGKNLRRAAFQVVAVDDAAAATLALHLRARDATPEPATDDGWLVRDHFELWIAGPRSELACDDTADLAGYCQRNPAALDAVAIAVAARRDGTLHVAPAAGAPPASWSGDLRARIDGGDLLVELTGALRDWARDGAITVAYSDSLRGTRQDAIVATSPVRADRPETLGRLGDTLLCDRPPPPPAH
jgi:hypothetical protein